MEQPVAVGLHLSGSNAPRSAIVCLDSSQNPPRVQHVFDRIGSVGQLFSDERIISVLKLVATSSPVMIDCPLSLPPCVRCSLQVCPGVVACSDLTVASMLSMNQKLKMEGRRKKRPINPQSQRLWDIGRASEPSYSANLAPLVARSLTLQRRLRDVLPLVEMFETSVPHVLHQLYSDVGLTVEHAQLYKSFERGGDIRSQWLDELIKSRLIAHPSIEDLQKIRSSIDVFHAFFAALMAAWFSQDKLDAPPKNYPVGEGWVYLPRPS